MIPPGPRLGDLVIEAEHLTKGYGDRLLIEDLTFRLPPGGIVGMIGPNGAGKTTLFRMIVGQEQPDGGAIRIGDTVKLGYVDQSRDALAANKTVLEEISGGGDQIELGKREDAEPRLCRRVQLQGPDQQKKVGELSGGERNRVHLAKLLKCGANVLLLDEPTNDLDVDTLRALEDALLEFAGCAVIISHDRWFLDRIATHILAFEGDSRVEWFEGNYQDYEADQETPPRRRRRPAAPHQVQAAQGDRDPTRDRPDPPRARPAVQGRHRRAADGPRAVARRQLRPRVRAGRHHVRDLRLRRAWRRAQTSSSPANLALAWMKARRSLGAATHQALLDERQPQLGAGPSAPRPASSTPSIRTWSSWRVAGSMVVSLELMRVHLAQALEAADLDLLALEDGARSAAPGRPRRGRRRSCRRG